MKHTQSSSFERLPRKQQNHKKSICYFGESIQANDFRKYLNFWHLCNHPFPKSQKTNNACALLGNSQRQYLNQTHLEKLGAHVKTKQEIIITDRQNVLGEQICQ